jgi:cytochrome b561
MYGYPRYSLIQRIIHWLVAVLAIGAIVLGLTLGFLGYEGAVARFGSETTNLIYKYHKTCGVLLLGLMTLRLFLKLVLVQPEYDPPLPPMQRIVSQAVHGTLYILVLAQAALGWAATAAGGYPVEFFKSVMPPILGKDPALSERLYALHYLVGLALAALIVLHIAAALMHWLVKRDTVMYRISLF